MLFVALAQNNNIPGIRGILPGKKVGRPPSCMPAPGMGWLPVAGMVP